MKITLKGNYRSLNTFIPEGTYELTDPILQGRGQYLLDTDHAFTLDPLPEKQEVKPVDNPDLVKSLRNRYEELADKKAFNGWDVATLLEKIADLEADNES